MVVLATAPFLAQNPVAATLPVGFRPDQDLIGIPFFTALGGSQPDPIPNQSGTLDILTDGRITNFSIFVDPQNGEWFPLNIIMPMAP
jgi:hypothetical protein